MNAGNHDNHTRVLPTGLYHNTGGIYDTEQHIQTIKSNVKQLNPLCRARAMHTSCQGHNNPNVPGQDNGMNAWMDVTLNPNSIDKELKLDAYYAKKNSDRNRCHDIDDVPMRGPPHRDDIPHNISVEEVTKTAEFLMNDDNLKICRRTGIMKPKNSPVRRPTSTVSAWAPHEKPQYIQKAQNYRSQDRNYEEHRYEEQGWDTDIEFSSDNSIPDKNKASNDNQFSRMRSDRGNRNMPSNQYSMRDRHSGRHDDRSQDIRTRDSEQPQNRRGKTPSEYFDSSSDSMSPRKSRNNKSGINAKPTSNVCIQLRYPHFSLGQMSGFIGQNIQFHHLSYEQFMAGELATIMNCDNPAEATGRLHLLLRIASWKLRLNVTWPQIRNVFVHILRCIENCEITWTANWDKFE